MIVETPDVLSLAFRVVSFVLVLSAAGVPIFIAVFGRLLPNTRAAEVRVGWRMATVALIFVAAHYLLEAGRMAGDMSGVVDPSMQATVLRSGAGMAFGLRAAGLVLIALGLRWPAAAIALLGTSLAILSFTMTGHTSISPHRPAAAALLVLHLLVVSFWMSALRPLYRASRTEPSVVTGRLIDAFSRTAAWSVPLIFLAGAGLGVLLVPDLSTFKQPYGQLLLAKAAGFAVLMGLAALNKWRYGPACAAGETRAFRRTVIVEYVLICLVLAMTATMTMFYSPEGT